MSHQYFKSLKGFFLFLLLIVFLLPQQIEAQRKKKLKKGEIETPVTPTPEKKKEKKFSDFIKSSKEIDGLFKIYQDTITGSLQMLISEDQLNKEYIHFNQIAILVIKI